MRISIKVSFNKDNFVFFYAQKIALFDVLNYKNLLLFIS